MASTYKTEFLDLNKWIGSDKPKREDFVSDNQKIDDAFNKHINLSDIHVSDMEKDKWNKASEKQYIIGTYTGDGYPTQNIDVGFEIDFVVVYAKNKMPYIMTAINQSMSGYMAIGSRYGSSYGVSIKDKAFSVILTSNQSVDGILSKLNEKDLEYIYIAFKK